jgi:hypothetical protein
MAQNANSGIQSKRAGKRAAQHDSAFRLQAIEPLLKLGRASEAEVDARAAEVGVSGRSLRRWIAAHEGRECGGGTLRVQFPDAADLVYFENLKGTSAREIHRMLAAAWQDMYPGKPCPGYAAVLGHINSLDEARR